MVSPEHIDMELTVDPWSYNNGKYRPQEYYDMMGETKCLNHSDKSDVRGLLNQAENLLEEYNHSCQPQSASCIVTTSGAIAEDSIYNCTCGVSTYTTKAYAFAILDSILIVITFTGKATTFDKYLSEFENSVKPVEISNFIDIIKSELYS